MGQREIFLPFFFFWQHLLHSTAQDKTNKRKMNSKKKSIDRKQKKKKKKKRNCNLWTTLGGEFTVDGEGTKTGGFAAGDGARGGRLGLWRSCRERMLEKTPEVVLQWSTQTLRQWIVICIFFFFE
jgi:hypothetical protein